MPCEANALGSTCHESSWKRHFTSTVHFPNTHYRRLITRKTSNKSKLKDSPQEQYTSEPSGSGNKWRVRNWHRPEDTKETGQPHVKSQTGSWDRKRTLTEILWKSDIIGIRKCKRLDFKQSSWFVILSWSQIYERKIELEVLSNGHNQFRTFLMWYQKFPLLVILIQCTHFAI